MYCDTVHAFIEENHVSWQRHKVHESCFGPRSAWCNYLLPSPIKSPWQALLPTGHHRALSVLAKTPELRKRKAHTVPIWDRNGDLTNHGLCRVRRPLPRSLRIVRLGCVEAKEVTALLGMHNRKSIQVNLASEIFIELVDQLTGLSSAAFGKSKITCLH